MIDLDVPEWSHGFDAAQGDDLTPRDGQDWVWREDRVRDLLLLNEPENLLAVAPRIWTSCSM